MIAFKPLNWQLGLMKQLTALFVDLMAGAIYKYTAPHKAAPYYTLRKDLAKGKVLHAMMQALNLQECIIWSMADFHAAVSGLAHEQHAVRSKWMQVLPDSTGILLHQYSTSGIFS